MLPIFKFLRGKIGERGEYREFSSRRDANGFQRLLSDIENRSLSLDIALISLFPDRCVNETFIKISSLSTYKTWICLYHKYFSFSGIC